MTVLDRFLKYVTFDTQSNEETGTTPSTPGQRVFAEALVKELEAIGMEEISLDENSYVMATLPANTDEKIPTIGFIAHLDTSPDMSGKNVQPRIVTYQRYGCAANRYQLSLRKIRDRDGGKDQ
jgi:tripeptide aminopeptidase